MECLAEIEYETSFSSSWSGPIQPTWFNYQYAMASASRKNKFLFNSNDGPTKVLPILNKSKEENPYATIDLINDSPVSNRPLFASIYVSGKLYSSFDSLNQDATGYAEKEDISIYTSGGKCIARLEATDTMKKQRAHQAKAKTKEFETTISFGGRYPIRRVDLLESYERVVVTKPVMHEIETSITFVGRLARRPLK